jgi:hypothetical protein
MPQNSHVSCFSCLFLEIKKEDGERSKFLASTLLVKGSDAIIIKKQICLEFFLQTFENNSGIKT